MEKVGMRVCKKVTVAPMRKQRMKKEEG